MRQPERETRIALASFALTFIIAYMIGLFVMHWARNSAIDEPGEIDWEWTGPLIFNGLVSLVIGVVVLLILYIAAQVSQR